MSIPTVHKLTKVGVLLVVLSLLNLAGCGGGAEGAARKGAGLVLTSIDVPLYNRVTKGAVFNFTATGHYADGTTANITSQVSWVSSAPTLASINSTGVATGISYGTTTITATLDTVVSAGAELYISGGAAGNLITGRHSHTATLLANGKLLVVGGISSKFGGTPISSAELFDPATGVWSATGSLGAGRKGHTATLLTDGRVLVAGGVTYASGSIMPINSPSEIYDPATGVWTTTGSTSKLRFDLRFDMLNAIRLNTGKVLLIDFALGETELFDPVSGTWTASGSLTRQRSKRFLGANISASLLPDGRVLVAGGDDPLNMSPKALLLKNVEIYNPATNAWTVAGNLNIPRSDQTATPLPNGKVLFAGSNFLTVAPTYAGFNSAELYDPATGISTSLGNWALPIGQTSMSHHTSLLMPSGKVLFIGSSPYISVEIYDPTTGTVVTKTSLIKQRDNTASTTLLNDGRVLITGGIDQVAFDAVYVESEFF